MLITRLYALVAIAPLVSSLPSVPSIMNKLKSIASRDDGCVYPLTYKITSLQVWTPTNGNSHPIVLDFQYDDDATHISTSCHYDGTQPNAGPEGFDPRYACEDPAVQFMWIQKTSMLSMIELVCPKNGKSDIEALDLFPPRLSCVDTTSNTPFGEGSQCFSLDFAVLRNFTTIDPVEPGPGGPPGK
ncbi:hypothetical protein B0T20DRAFT_355305 [Sordaria brevicollis]|uniref:AA1-like domain-containing protein n=1 Tax=Sordaria brevicollis TaxID=83679 RepID=A0AAE0UBV3_SORBR|nr:hypothetical protein B0T20DRAFT_355305 [Sordaria brevicollis]